MSERKLISREQAAEMLDISVSMLKKLTSPKTCVKLGRAMIPHVKLGGSVRFDTADLWAWIESKKIVTSPRATGAAG